MAKSKVSIQALLGLGLKENEGGFEFEFKLNQVLMRLISQQLQDEAL
jgi:hypothetical protein